MNQPQALLRLVNVSKRYGRVVALSDATVEVQPGEFVSILGPSGCGKSTILKLFAGVISPSEGSVLVRGREITELPTAELGIVMVWQSLALFPHMNVERNLEFGLAVRGVDPGERRQLVRRYLEMVELAGFERRSVNDLSGGEKQRVALARALIVKPDVILLDEPLTGLDREVRAAMLAKLRAIHRTTGVTLVLVTHDHAEAMLTSSRIVVLNRGRVEQTGTPFEISTRPRSVFVARFVGRKNVLHARVTAIDAARATVDTPAGCLQACLPDWIDHSIAAGDEVAYVVEAYRVLVGTAAPNQVEGRLDLQALNNGLCVIELNVEGLGPVRSEQPLAGQCERAPGDVVRLCWHTEDAYILPAR